MTMTLAIQFVAAAFSVMLGAFLFAWAICKALSFEDRKEGVSKAMLTDILQALFDAKQAGDENEIEQNYWALEQLGMDRMTADEVLRAGKKFFRRKNVKLHHCRTDSCGLDICSHELFMESEQKSGCKSIRWGLYNSDSCRYSLDSILADIYEIGGSICHLNNLKKQWLHWNLVTMMILKGFIAMLTN